MLQCIRRSLIIILPLVFFFGWQIENEIEAKQLAPVDSFEALLSDASQKNKEYRAGSPKIVKLLERRLGLGSDFSKEEILELANNILSLSRHYDFPPSFVLSIIEVESQFRRNAISHRGAIGLMQLRETTAEAIAGKMGVPWEGAESLHDPKLNLDMALHYFSELRKSFKTAKYYVTAYNRGPSRVKQMLDTGVPLPERYYNYYNKVYTSYSSYRGAF